MGVESAHTWVWPTHHDRAIDLQSFRVNSLHNYTDTSESGRFSKVVQIFIVKVPNESAILVDDKNMHIDGGCLRFTGNTIV